MWLVNAVYIALFLFGGLPGPPPNQVPLDWAQASVSGPVCFECEVRVFCSVFGVVSGECLLSDDYGYTQPCDDTDGRYTSSGIHPGEKIGLPPGAILENRDFLRISLTMYFFLVTSNYDFLFLPFGLETSRRYGA